MFAPGRGASDAGPAFPQAEGGCIRPLVDAEELSMQHDHPTPGGPLVTTEPPHTDPHTAGFHLPAPSIWPATFAAGIGLLGFGVLTSLVFSAAGLGVVAWALAGWIREMLHE